MKSWGATLLETQMNSLITDGNEVPLGLVVFFFYLLIVVYGQGGEKNESSHPCIACIAR